MHNEFAAVDKLSLIRLRDALILSLESHRENLRERFEFMINEKNGDAWNQHGGVFRLDVIDYQETVKLHTQIHNELIQRSGEEGPQ